jgi:hypothetical protein
MCQYISNGAERVYNEACRSVVRHSRKDDGNPELCPGGAGKNADNMSAWCKWSTGNLVHANIALDNRRQGRSLAGHGDGQPQGCVVALLSLAFLQAGILTGQPQYDAGASSQQWQLAPSCSKPRASILHSALRHSPRPRPKLAVHSVHLANETRGNRPFAQIMKSYMPREHGSISQVVSICSWSA